MFSLILNTAIKQTQAISAKCPPRISCHPSQAIRVMSAPGPRKVCAARSFPLSEHSGPENLECFLGCAPSDFSKAISYQTLYQEISQKMATKLRVEGPVYKHVLGFVLASCISGRKDPNHADARRHGKLILTGSLSSYVMILMPPLSGLVWEGLSHLLS